MYRVDKHWYAMMIIIICKCTCTYILGKSEGKSSKFESLSILLTWSFGVDYILLTAKYLCLVNCQLVLVM